MTTVVKVAIISQTSTSFVPLADAASIVAREAGSYVYRVWEFDPATREYIFDTGTNNYEPVCIFPQPA